MAEFKPIEDGWSFGGEMRRPDKASKVWRSEALDAIDRRDLALAHWQQIASDRQRQVEWDNLKDRLARALEQGIAYRATIARLRIERDNAREMEDVHGDNWEAATAEIERLRGEVERLREFELAVERFAAMAQRFRQSAHECVIDGDAVSCSVAARLVDYARTIEATIEPDCCCGQRPNECVCGCYEGEDGDE